MSKWEETETNIWNVTQYRTKLPLSMFFVDLKPAPNNKDIFQVDHLQQCKITFDWYLKTP
jgi:hypothetical protein